MNKLDFLYQKSNCNLNVRIPYVKPYKKIIHVHVHIKKLKLNHQVFHKIKNKTYIVKCSQSTSEGGESGKLTNEIISSMKSKIESALNTNEVSVIDINGDGRHVSIDVISTEFEGKSKIDRQRMVYKAIWLELQDVVHAVDQMTTKTPDEVNI